VDGRLHLPQVVNLVSSFFFDGVGHFILFNDKEKRLEDAVKGSEDSLTKNKN
jgi:hypothetical protein